MTKLRSHDLIYLKSIHPRYVMQREYEEAYQEALAEGNMHGLTIEERQALEWEQVEDILEAKKARVIQ